MNYRSKLLATFALSASSLGFVGGCGNSTVSSNSGGRDPAVAHPNATDASVLASSAGSNADPASAAKQTVAVFLDCLRRGDETTANSMLTSKAREELQKTAWVMQPLGTPEGQFTIGRAGFPYEDKSVVLVESRWQEPGASEGNAVAMDIVCELYQEAEGWRIAGMAVNLPGEEDALVIDFEDGKRLQEMLDFASSGNPSGSPAQPVAQPGAYPSSLDHTQLPALPQFPSADGTQIAAPPTNSNGILR